MPLSFIILEIIFGVLNMSWEKPEEGIGPKSLSEAISYSNHRTFYFFSFSKRRPSAVVLILHLVLVIGQKVAKEGKFQTRVIFAQLVVCETTGSFIIHRSAQGLGARFGDKARGIN